MIFQSDIASINNEIELLLAQIEVARQKQAQLSELDALTDSSLTQLRDIVSKIGHYAPDAIASLKTAVLTLFDSGGGGSQPIDPTPDDDPTPGADPEGDDFDIIALNGETGDCLTTDDLDDIDDAPTGTVKLTYVQAIKNRCSACWGYEVTSKGDIKSGFINRADLGFMEAVNLERSGKEFYETIESYLNKLYYTGQSCDWASPFASHLACLLWEDAPLSGQSCTWASPLCSLLWEDTPLTGQYCTITLSATETIENKGTSEGEHMFYIELVQHPQNSAIAYQRKRDGELICVYVGFRTKALASSWKQAVEVLTSNVEMRSSKRLQNFKWELKVKGLSMAQINRLASEDLNKSYRAEVGSAKPPSYNPQLKPEAVNPDEVQPGGEVTKLS